VIFIVIGAVGFFGLVGIGYMSYVEDSQTVDRKLQSFSVDRRISGDRAECIFYLFDIKYFYFFYYKVSDNEFKSDMINADRAKIYEKNNCTPHMVEYAFYIKNNMNRVLRRILAFGYGEGIEKRYDIYIPKDTIFRTFN